MASRLPLEHFRFFEAAARHVNFTRAATELCVTHGAVSQRIKIIEEELQTKLFARDGRNMRLTPAGTELYERIKAALNEIDRAVELLRNGNANRPLTVSVLPAFATRWLIPRLGNFNKLYPNIPINIRAGFTLADFDRDGVDVAIRFGLGNWPSVKSEKLFDDELFPVCAPGFQGGISLLSPEDVLRYPLLHDERQPWTIWLAATGIQEEPKVEGPVYGNSNLLLEAAAAGHGIALARATFVKPDLDSGRLIRLSQLSAKTRYSHYVVYPAAPALPKAVNVFRSWLMEFAAP